MTNDEGACGSRFVLATSPAHALTGAELLQTERQFASGYIYGVFEYVFHVAPDDDDAARNFEIRNCLMASKVTSDTMYSVVTAYVRAHPETLQYPSVAAVLQVINEMCPQ